jgi:hypothetical protein
MVQESGDVGEDEGEQVEVELMGMCKGRLYPKMQLQSHNKHHQRQKMRLQDRRRRLPLA